MIPHHLQMGAVGDGLGMKKIVRVGDIWINGNKNVHQQLS
jgi:hypothetical protein